MKQQAPLTTLEDIHPRVLRGMTMTAHGCVALMFAVWYLLWAKYGEPYGHAWLLVPTELLSGRAGATGLGLKQHFPKAFLLFQICLQDFILMLYAYPLFVRGYHLVSHVPIVGRYLAEAHEFALQHKDRIAPFGAVGLMLFVLFPLWSTGPLVGVIVGYLIGLPTWLSFASVILGNIAATAAWIFFYRQLHDFHPGLANVLLAIILVAAVAAAVAGWIRRRKKIKKASCDAVETEPAAPEKLPDEPSHHEV